MSSEVERAEVTSKKVWSVGQIGTLAFFGGPFAGAFFLSKNYKVFENQAAAKKIIRLGALFTSLVFVMVGLLPDALIEKLPNYSIPAVYMVIMMHYTKKHQKDLISEHLKIGKKQSHWKTFGLCFPFMILAFVWGFGIIFTISMIKDLIFGV